MGKEAMVAAGDISSVIGKQRVINAGAPLVSSFYADQDSNPRNAAAIFRLGLPISIKLSR